ncbi:hypothetical protein [Paractinoplanes maris]|uniref:hypothetical protein n=1 Tax=Paractinoplanes maris TaxID=1734446 RepID=UPI00201FCB78|nr:hypothetical protein [Actinoplanes maris]
MGLLFHLIALPFRRPLVGILIGLAILGGVFAYDWDSAPTCGGSTMEQGDVCRKVTDTTGSSDRTFDETKDNQRSAPYIWGSLGGALVLIGAVSWPIRRRRRAAQADAAAATVTTTA